MMTGIQANLGLKLIREYIAATGDEEAKGHFNALVLRFQALQAEQQAATVIDEHGNITIGLKSIGAVVETVTTR